MRTTEIKTSSDDAYYARCIRRLKEWGAPLEGWQCVDVIDVREDDKDAPLSTCELCDCSRVRFEHIMTHNLYFEPVTVGCICAGIMEGDILAAEERERQMRNRAKRRRTFLKRRWQQDRPSVWHQRYRKHDLLILKSASGYTVYSDGKVTRTYKDKPIANFYTASCAAFTMADPPWHK